MYFLSKEYAIYKSIQNYQKYALHSIKLILIKLFDKKNFKQKVTENKYYSSSA